MRSPEPLSYFPSGTEQYRWVVRDLSSGDAVLCAASSLEMQAEQFPGMFGETVAQDAVAAHYNAENPDRVRQEAELLAGSGGETYLFAHEVWEGQHTAIGCVAVKSWGHQLSVREHTMRPLDKGITDALLDAALRLHPHQSQITFQAFDRPGQTERLAALTFEKLGTAKVRLAPQHTRDQHIFGATSTAVRDAIAVRNPLFGRQPGDTNRELTATIASDYTSMQLEGELGTKHISLEPKIVHFGSPVNLLRRAKAHALCRLGEEPGRSIPRSELLSDLNTALGEQIPSIVWDRVQPFLLGLRLNGQPMVSQVPSSVQATRKQRFLRANFPIRYLPDGPDEP